jgi:hypothetical protein
LRKKLLGFASALIVWKRFETMLFIRPCGAFAERQR